MAPKLDAELRQVHVRPIGEVSSREVTSADETTPLLVEACDCNNRPHSSVRFRARARKTLGPDGGEAWCVALAACLISFIMAGLGRMSGVLYVAFIDIYGIDRKQASLPFSVRSSTRNLLGPVVGILGQKYGVRPVTVIGSILGALSAAACFYVEDILWMTIVWGGFNGIGTALSTTLPQVTIGQHFKKHLSTASGMSFSGGCVGSFVFPVLLEYLLHKYSLGGTFLILAGILMHVIPAAMVLREPTWLKRKVTAANADDNEIAIVIGQRIQDETENCENETDAHNLSREKAKSFPKCSFEIKAASNTSNNLSNSHLLWENRKLVMRLLTNDFTLQSPPSKEVNQNKAFTNDTLIQEIEDLFNKMVTDVQDDKISEKDSDNISVKANGKFEDKCAARLTNKTYINGSPKSQMIDFDVICSNPLNSLYFYLENLFEKNKGVIVQTFSAGERECVAEILEELEKMYIILKESKKNIYSCTHSTTSLFLDSNSINFDDNFEHPNTFSSHIITTLKLHAKPLFLLICLCRSVHFLIFTPVVMTIVDFSMDKGLLAEDGKYVIAALSLGDLLGRLCLGWITDKKYVSLPRFMLFVMIIQGASTAILPLMDSKESLMSAITVFGLLQGSTFVLHPVLVTRYLGSHEQSIAMGCINFLSGILAFALPNYIGYFRDTIGSYNGMFYINGGVGAFIGLLWVFEPYFFKLSVERARRNRQAQV